MSTPNPPWPRLLLPDYITNYISKFIMSWVCNTSVTYYYLILTYLVLRFLLWSNSNNATVGRISGPWWKKKSKRKCEQGPTFQLSSCCSRGNIAHNTQSGLNKSSVLNSSKSESAPFFAEKRQKPPQFFFQKSAIILAQGATILEIPPKKWLP